MTIKLTARLLLAVIGLGCFSYFIALLSLTCPYYDKLYQKVLFTLACFIVPCLAIALFFTLVHFAIYG